MNAVAREFEPSGRTSNRMDQESRAIHDLLEQWGKWALDSTLRAYPPITLLGRMIKYGPRGAAESGPPPVAMPSHIAAVDAAVAKLGEIDRKAIKAYYTREQPTEACAKDCHMRVRQFQNVLRRARWRVAIFISSNVTHKVD